MRFKIEKSFDRDVDKIKNKQVLKKLQELISTIGDAETIREIPHSRKIEGASSAALLKRSDPNA